ncbi:MAG: PHP domain-containing protein, partial [Gallionella sp.]
MVLLLRLWTSILLVCSLLCHLDNALFIYELFYGGSLPRFKKFSARVGGKIHTEIFYLFTMSQPAFIHLRLHSEYSISDGMVRVDEAVAAAHGDAMPALAMTDLNNFFGLVKFYQASRSKGIKPIIGCDVFITNDADRERPY